MLEKKRCEIDACVTILVNVTLAIARFISRLVRKDEARSTVVIAGPAKAQSLPANRQMLKMIVIAVHRNSSYESIFVGSAGSKIGRTV